MPTRNLKFHNKMIFGNEYSSFSNTNVYDNNLYNLKSINKPSQN